MAQVNLGRIGFVNKGSWDNATNYKLNDVVKYGGSIYAAKRPNVGVTPPTNGTDTNDWFYFVNNSNSDYVDRTSNQDIPGIKNFTNGITTSKINGNPIVNDKMTFNVSPIVPTPTTATQAANKAYVDSKTNITGSDTTAVKLTGNQTIADVKTFSSSPIVPTPTANTEAANKGYVDSKTLNIDSTAVKTALNASGAAPIYACRAWVNFNGTGTVAIRASGNVSSITDNGEGDYTVNFITAMQDTNYSVLMNIGDDTYTNNRKLLNDQTQTAVGQTISSVKVISESNGQTPYDPRLFYVAIFR